MRQGLKEKECMCCRGRNWENNGTGIKNVCPLQQAGRWGYIHGVTRTGSYLLVHCSPTDSYRLGDSR